ncbi:MAG: helix-turn-helix domain-containing protein [Micrococcus sp.]|nr:helix-turn-helix domain-containing protein [Micrococcus sp.]
MRSEVANLELIPTSQAASILGRGISTVHDMVTRGDLTPRLKSPGLRGAMFFSRADVEALLTPTGEDDAA